MTFDINQLNFTKGNGLVPTIVQHAEKGSVLMLGFMNQDAILKTIETKHVTFFSRTKNRLWTKGETSGHQLELIDLFMDCDKDTLLILAKPQGPVCHQGTETCFISSELKSDWQCLFDLENTIARRSDVNPSQSYTAQLLQSPLNRVAQKVGEESIEVVLAALGNDPEALCEEVADLLYHLLVLLKKSNVQLFEVLNVLKKRQSAKSEPKPTLHRVS